VEDSLRVARCLVAIWDGVTEQQGRAAKLSPDGTVEGSTVAEACHHPDLIDGRRALAKQASRIRELTGAKSNAGRRSKKAIAKPRQMPIAGPQECGKFRRTRSGVPVVAVRQILVDSGFQLLF